MRHVEVGTMHPLASRSDELVNICKYPSWIDTRRRLQPLTQEEAALRIQRIGRGMIARRRVARESEAEEVFIGMRLAVSHFPPSALTCLPLVHTNYQE